MKPRSPTPKAASRRAFDTRAENALQPFVLDPHAIYSLAAVAAMLDVPRRSILVYCKHGLVTPATDPLGGGFYFDAEAIRALRRIKAIRQIRGNELATIGVVLDLMRRVEQLNAEIQSLRG